MYVQLNAVADVFRLLHYYFVRFYRMLYSIVPEPRSTREHDIEREAQLEQ